MLPVDRATTFALRLAPVLVPVVAVLAALAAGAPLIALAGVSPLAAYASMLTGAFGSVNNLAESLVKTTPFLLAGLGIAVALRGRLINIGAEGQLLMGGIGAAWVGLFLGDLPAALGIPLTLVAGFMLGAVWAAIAMALKLRFGANEIMVTLMMNYVAAEILSYLISGPWRDPESTEPFTALVAGGTRLPVLVPATRLHAGIAIALAATIVIGWLMRHTVFGYQLGVTGASARAARYSGIRTAGVLSLAMVMSGGLAGLAGVAEVSGLHHRLLEGLSPGYGYTAIAIAMLGTGRPYGVMLAAFFFAALVVGADGMQRAMNVPVSVVLMLQGLVLLLILVAEFLVGRWTRAVAAATAR